MATDRMTALRAFATRYTAAWCSQGTAVCKWALEGRNTGPGGTGNRVRVSGFEEWQLGGDGLIANSLGHCDAADCQRQVEAGH